MPKNSNAKDDGASEQRKFGEVLMSYAPNFFFLSELNLNSFKTGGNLQIQPLKKKSDWKGNRTLRSENATC